MDFNTIVFIGLNLLLYAAGIYVFWEVIKIVRSLAPKFLAGQVSFTTLLYIGAGILTMLAMLMFLPYQTAKAIQYGWNQFMPVMAELSQGVVTDIDQILSGNMPVYIAPKPKVTPQAAVTVEATNPNLHNSGGAGNGFITGDAVWARPGENGGIDTSDTEAGGGAPSPEQFDINTWTPDQPTP